MRELRPGNACTLGELHEYWTRDNDGTNPHKYARFNERGELVYRLIDNVVQRGEPVLELGCNVGRNLEMLRRGGYTNLAGVELNAGACEAMQVHYPELAAMLKLTTGSIEGTLPKLADNAYGLIFTMTVLMHIHPDSEWIFAHIARAARNVLVIENEEANNNCRWARNYGEIFTKLGCVPVLEEYNSLGSHYYHYAIRLFNSEGVTC
jgi:SAM-dependent methyltransferase